MGPTAKSDRAATALSGLCILHCLALPLLASVAPIFSVAAEAEWVHIVFASLAAVVSMSVPLRDASARGLGFVGPAGLGVAFLVAGIFADEFGADETVLTVIGGVLVAFAHIRRMVSAR